MITGRCNFGVLIDEKQKHPSYPATGKAKGEATWRCKECHGWDYKGSSGTYSKGKHYTGIKGIQGYIGKDPEKIMEILKDDTHALRNILKNDALEALSLFVAYGQIDMDIYIDRSSKKSNGDAINGGRYFYSTCKRCHG
jgi:thiosulfate dehydrogenase